MKVLSAANLQGKYRAGMPYPREGSRIRKVYDRLHDAPGVFVEIDDLFPESHKRGVLLEQLRNFYGLEIETIRGYRNRHGLYRQSLWRLVGEYFGSEKVDYV